MNKVGKLQWYEKLQRKTVKSFTVKEELFIRTVKLDYFCRPIKCPECASLMANLGLDFKAPPKNAIKQWSIIEGMYITGHSFYSCGCNGPGFIPNDKIQYKEYLVEKLNEYRKCFTKAQTTFDRRYHKSERLKYWDDRIKLVEKEISKIN